MRLPYLRAILALALALALPAQARTFSFAPLPMEQPETVVKQARPMLTYLEPHLGGRLRIVYSSDYDDILKQFQAGTVDLAYLGLALPGPAGALSPGGAGGAFRREVRPVRLHLRHRHGG